MARAGFLFNNYGWVRFKFNSNKRRVQPTHQYKSTQLFFNFGASNLGSSYLRSFNLRAFNLRSFILLIFEQNRHHLINAVMLQYHTPHQDNGLLAKVAFID